MPRLKARMSLRATTRSSKYWAMLTRPHCLHIDAWLYRLAYGDGTSRYYIVIEKRAGGNDEPFEVAGFSPYPDRNSWRLVAAPLHPLAKRVKLWDCLASDRAWLNEVHWRCVYPRLHELTSGFVSISSLCHYLNPGDVDPHPTPAPLQEII